MFYLNSPLNFGIPPVLVFQLEVDYKQRRIYYKVDRLLTGLTAQQNFYHKICNTFTPIYLFIVMSQKRFILVLFMLSLSMCCN